jgi:AcrR family transcriptional regulator
MSARATTKKAKSEPLCSDADVRQAILEAAVAAIEEAGLAAVSMREVARRAGVSHQLPYHYFVDREGILAAVAERGFDMLGARMKAVFEAKGTGPERIAAAGRAYVEFAWEHPAHFRVMFRQDFVRVSDYPSVHARADVCFGWLPQLVADCIEEGLDPSPNVEAIVVMGWSIAHGLACLLLDGPLEKKLPDAAHAREATVRQVMEAFRRLLESATVSDKRRTSAR